MSCTAAITKHTADDGEKADVGKEGVLLVEKQLGQQQREDWKHSLNISSSEAKTRFTINTQPSVVQKTEHSMSL